jgi:peptidoglycan-associated lipoprotein
VREELALQGIDPRRIFTISYGEDQPAVDGHDESAWSRNRRGELILLNAQ